MVREPVAPAPRTAESASLPGRTGGSPGPGQASPGPASGPDPLRDLAERLRRGVEADVLVLLRPGDPYWDAQWAVLETAPAAGGALAPQLPAVLPGPRDAPEAAVVEAGDTPLGRLLAPAGLETLLQVPLRVADELWGLLCLGRAGPTGPAELSRAQAEAAAMIDLLVLAERLRASERRADTDPLTGLANRRAFDERAQAAFEEHLRSGTAIAVVMCDLNGLKSVNDRAGHDAGDRLLIAVGQVLARAAGSVASAAGVVPARLGGDEFGLLLVGVPDEQVVGLAAECCRQVEQLPEGAGLSCGVATTSGVLEPVADVHHLLRLADAAQYRAKRLAARGPVVAGRPLDLGADGRAADAAVARGRRRRHPLVGVLAAGAQRLAEVEDEPTPERLVQLGTVLAERLDAAGWEVVHLPPGAGVATVVAAGEARPGRARPVGAQVGLADELGADAAAEHPPSTGPRAGAEATGSDGTWQLEVHLDEPTGPPHQLDDVLRALVTLAVRPS